MCKGPQQPLVQWSSCQCRIVASNRFPWSLLSAVWDGVCTDFIIELFKYGIIWHNGQHTKPSNWKMFSVFSITCYEQIKPSRSINLDTESVRPPLSVFFIKTNNTSYNKNIGITNSLLIVANRNVFVLFFSKKNNSFRK